MDHQWVREEQVDAEENLDHVGDNALFRQACSDQRFIEIFCRTPGQQSELSENNIEHGDKSHCDTQKLVVLRLVRGDFLNRKNNANSFVCIDREADRVGPQMINRFDAIHLNTFLAEIGACIPEDYYQGYYDKYVTEEVRHCEHFNLTYHNKWNVDSHTDGHPQPFIDYFSITVSLDARDDTTFTSYL